MKLSDERRAQMLRTTRDAAVAYLEDMEYIRSIANKKDTARGEVRRLSGILRRLLVEGDISKIASPRTGRIFIKAPDNNPIYKSRYLSDLLFFLSGRANVYGWVGTVAAWNIPENAINSIAANHNLSIVRRIDLPLKNFLTQRVVFYQGEWADRKSIIKYVAQVTSGIHSGTPKSREEIFLSKVRNNNFIRRDENGKLQWALHDRAHRGDEMEFVYTKDSIDVTLIEILAAACFLAESPDLEVLEKIIVKEVS